MSVWTEKLLEKGDEKQTKTRKRRRPWSIHKKIRMVIYTIALALLVYGVSCLMR